jgi:hypothetical protein
MSVLKQIAIHNISAAFGLPWEMSQEIMGFCFYDTVTAVGRAVHKANMAEIVGRFNNAYVSRARPNGFMEGDPDGCEHWGVCLSDPNDENDNFETQFQACNCNTCGNYKASSTHFPREAIPIRMRCCCG